jgi:hypothetical protein
MCEPGGNSFAATAPSSALRSAYGRHARFELRASSLFTTYSGSEFIASMGRCRIRLPSRAGEKGRRGRLGVSRESTHRLAQLFVSQSARLAKVDRLSAC